MAKGMVSDAEWRRIQARKCKFYMPAKKKLTPEQRATRRKAKARWNAKETRQRQRQAKQDAIEKRIAEEAAFVAVFKPAIEKLIRAEMKQYTRTLLAEMRRAKRGK